MVEEPENIDTENPEFQDALRLIENTNSSVYLTGRAGTGKSTFLRHICRTIPKKMVVVAPTGIAAINAGGVTIHSFFKVPFRPILPDDPDLSTKKGRIFDFLKYRKAHTKIIEELELIIIDEVSMVRGDVLDFVDRVLRVYTKNMNLPFGGKQMLMVGDVFQLEPVVKRDDWQILNRFYKTGYFFGARVFQKIPLVQIELKKVYRQNDQSFVNLLDRIRVKKATNQDIDAINQRFDPNFSTPVDELFITLATRRNTVDYTNDTKLKELEGEEITFTGNISGDFPESGLPTLKQLILKENAQVMFVKNDMEKRWYNGSLGRIDEITDEGIYVRLENGEVEFVTREIWRNIRYKYDEKNNKIIEEELGSFTQYPLKLAWAITVHKSQGLTFDKVLIDFSGGAFAGGQLYVALSRCRSLEGIILKTKITTRDMIVNPKAVDFSKSANDKRLIQQELDKAQARDLFINSLYSYESDEFFQAVKNFAMANDKQEVLSVESVQRLIAIKLAKVSHLKQRIVKAKKELKQQQDNVAEFAREYFLMANECKLKFNDTSSAIANLNKAIKLNSQFHEAYLRRGSYKIEIGDLKGAEADFTQVLKIKKRNFMAFYNRGRLRMEQNRLEQAYNDLIEAINIRKSNAEAHYFLGVVCEKMGHADEADKYKNMGYDLGYEI